MPQMSSMNWMMVMLYFFMIMYMLLVILSYKNNYSIKKNEILKIDSKNFKFKW
uniref:ATP synthase subunit 8 n=1 Tax=Chrysis fulgida TaxID=913288 RepID=A0A1D9CJM3_9HYME|nr:ATP synthase subunit 8 [Chrysis fulgida]